MAKSSKPQTRPAYRDAGDGQFITKKEADKKPPNQVVKERVPLPGKGKK